MKINREEFLNELGELFPALGMGSDNPNNFFNFINKNDKTYIMATNDTSVAMIVSKFKFEDGSVCGTELFNLLRMLKSEDIEVFTINGSFSIRTDSSVTDICIEKLHTSILDTIDFKKTWLTLPDNFCDSINVCVSSCANDSSVSDFFTYVYTEGNTVVASNGGIITQAELVAPVEKMFISSKSIKMLTKFKPSLYKKCNGWLLFTRDQVMLAIRTIDDSEQYPLIVNKENYSEEELCKRKRFILENLMNIDGTEITVNNKYDLINAVKTCNLFSKKDKGVSFIEVSISDVLIKVTANGARGKTENTVVNNSGNSAVIYITSTLMLDLLDFTDSFIVTPDRILAKKENVTKLVALCKKK